MLRHSCGATIYSATYFITKLVEIVESLLEQHRMWVQRKRPLVRCIAMEVEQQAIYWLFYCASPNPAAPPRSPSGSAPYGAPTPAGSTPMA